MNRNWLTCLAPLPGDFSGLETPMDLAAWELKNAPADNPPNLVLNESLGDGFVFRGNTLTGGETGLLYGVYAWLRRARCGGVLPESSSPAYSLRMISWHVITHQSISYMPWKKKTTKIW